MDRQVGSSREVLPQQKIRVFVGAALPGTLRITEVDLHIIRRYREVFADRILDNTQGTEFVPPPRSNDLLRCNRE